MPNGHLGGASPPPSPRWRHLAGARATAWLKHGRSGKWGSDDAHFPVPEDSFDNVKHSSPSSPSPPPPSSLLLILFPFFFLHFFIRHVSIISKRFPLIEIAVNIVSISSSSSSSPLDQPPNWFNGNEEIRKEISNFRISAIPVFRFPTPMIDGSGVHVKRPLHSIQIPCNTLILIWSHVFFGFLC